MGERHRDMRGFTLVELIIVLALVGILAGISVPTIARMGVFSHSDTQDAAREAVNLLKAARLHAATYRVDTALVYAVNARPDSEFGQGDRYRIVADGLGIARRMSDEEMESLGLSGVDAFVLLRNEEGQMQALAHGATIRIFNETDEYVAPSDTFDLPTDAVLQEILVARALKPIAVYIDSDGVFSQVSPRTPGSPNIALGYTDVDYFPAHVFGLSGQVRSSSDKMRVQLSVTPAPDAPTVERFTENGQEVVPIDVELFTATGRVKVAS